MLDLKFAGESQTHMEGLIIYLIVRSFEVEEECLLGDNSFWAGKDHHSPRPPNIGRESRA